MPVITLYLNSTLLSTNDEAVYLLSPDSPGTTYLDSYDYFDLDPDQVGMRFWKWTGTEEVEITGGTPVAVADLVLVPEEVTVVSGQWTLTSQITNVKELIARPYLFLPRSNMWVQMMVGEYHLAFKTSGFNATLNPATWTVYYAFYFSGQFDILTFRWGMYPEWSRIAGVDYTPTPSLTYKVSGYTRDQNNNPIPNCIVVLYDALTDAKVASTVSDSSGYFEFTGLSSAGAYYIRAYKSGTPNLIGVTSRNIYGVPE